MATDYRTRVRRLMETAQAFTDAGNEEAAQTYAEKAATLATKHGVEEALSEAFADRGTAEIIAKTVIVSNPYPKHRITLIGYIGKHMNCHVVKDGRNGAQIFGDSRDVERVMFLYRLISAHMLDGVSKASPPKPLDDSAKHAYFKKAGLTPAEVKSFRVSWVVGYLHGIYFRMEEAYKATVEEAKQTNPGAAIVLADRRALAKRKMDDDCGAIGKVASSRVNHRSAYRAGREASKQADLGQVRIGSIQRELTA